MKSLADFASQPARSLAYRQQRGRILMSAQIQVSRFALAVKCRMRGEALAHPVSRPNACPASHCTVKEGDHVQTMHDDLRIKLNAMHDAWPEGRTE